MSWLDSLLGHSTAEFQALQLIVLAVFGAVDLQLASWMLVQFLEINFEMVVGFGLEIMKNNFFIIIDCVLHIS